jgi:hypothetical protein
MVSHCPADGMMRYVVAVAEVLGFGVDLGPASVDATAFGTVS